LPATEVVEIDRERTVEIWVVEEDDGFISALEVVRSDGTREIMRLQRSGAAASVHATP